MTDVHPLKRYRDEHDVTLAQLAKRVETSEASLSRIERRKQAPSLRMLERLKAITGLSADDFLRSAQ